MSEPEHVGLVLGQGARDRGARCDQIPESLPGVGYVAVEGRAEPVRLRFGHITDEHITRLVHDYEPRPQITVAAELPATRSEAAA